MTHAKVLSLPVLLQHGTTVPTLHTNEWLNQVILKPLQLLPGHKHTPRHAWGQLLLPCYHHLILGTGQLLGSLRAQGNENDKAKELAFGVSHSQLEKKVEEEEEKKKKEEEEEEKKTKKMKKGDRS